MQIELIQDPRETKYIAYCNYSVGDYVRPEEPCRMFICAEGIRDWFDVSGSQKELTLKISKRPNRHAYKCKLGNGKVRNTIRIFDPSRGTEGRWTSAEIYCSFKAMLDKEIGTGEFYLSVDIPS